VLSGFVSLALGDLHSFRDGKSSQMISMKHCGASHSCSLTVVLLSLVTSSDGSPYSSHCCHRRSPVPDRFLEPGAAARSFVKLLDVTVSQQSILPSIGELPDLIFHANKSCGLRSCASVAEGRSAGKPNHIVEAHHPKSHKHSRKAPIRPCSMPFNEQMLQLTPPEMPCNF
jgi:hypothetical protein